MNIPAEGLELIEKMAKNSGFQDVTGEKSIYILIQDGDVSAIGARYSKSKNTYKW